MIVSLCDTDLYKFTMMQTVLHRFSEAQVEYELIVRQNDRVQNCTVQQLEEALAKLPTLALSQEEHAFLANLPFFYPDFIDFLRNFRFNLDYLKVESKQGIQLKIKGPWIQTILFEVPLLAILTELRGQSHDGPRCWAEGRARLERKIELIQRDLNDERFRFMDFGTRRRFSFAWQDHVLSTLKNAVPQHFIGSSNVVLAARHGLKPIGTMAHEYLQACQVLGPHVRYSQRYAFEVWAQEYRGQLGILLSDIFGLDAFLKDFTLDFCKLFDGVRHDSGDPIQWGERILAHYQKHGIDPRQKTLVFSDSLTFPKILELFHRFKDRTQLLFGIGTDLTHDMGFPAPQTVIKMVRCNGLPVAKISDTPEKAVCSDPAYLAYLKTLF